MRADQAVFHRIAAGTDMFPSCQIFAVEKLLPLAGVAIAGVSNCDRYTRLHLVVTRDQHRAGQAHHELLEACKTKDPDLAAAALWKHIADAGQYLREFIKGHGKQHS